MRKVPSHLGVAALAALGLLGLSAQAAVASDPEPDCAGQPQGIRYGWVQTEPDTQFAVTEYSGGAVLCGSDKQTERGYLTGIIRSPELSPPGQGAKGMTFRCANPRNPSACTGQEDIAEQRFVGSAEADVMSCTDILGCSLMDNRLSRIYVDNHPNANVPENTHCAATYQDKPVVQCLQGADSLMAIGYSDMVVTKEQDGGEGSGVYKLYMFQPQSLPALDPFHLLRLYYTKLGSRGVWGEDEPGEPWEMIKDPLDTQEEIHTCMYAGAVGGTTCGTNPANWLQKNGARQNYGCFVGQPGQVQPSVPWGFRATRTAGWSPPNANVCATERWTPTAGAAGNAKR